MRLSLRSKLFSVAITAFAVASVTPAPAEAAPKDYSSPVILDVHKNARLAADASYVELTVRYACTNTATTLIYITADTGQEGTVYYHYGERGAGPIVTATCTGHPVTETLLLPRGDLFDPYTSMHTGPAAFHVGLETRAPFGVGAGYYQIDYSRTVTTSGTVNVR